METKVFLVMTTQDLLSAVGSARAFPPLCFKLWTGFFLLLLGGTQREQRPKKKKKKKIYSHNYSCITYSSVNYIYHIYIITLVLIYLLTGHLLFLKAYLFKKNILETLLDSHFTLLHCPFSGFTNFLNL